MGEKLKFWYVQKCLRLVLNYVNLCQNYSFM